MINGSMNLSDRNKKSDKEDLKWVRKAKSGNRKAFEKLVQKYQKRIYFTTRKIVLDHEDSNDVVQDTFVKSYIKLEQFNEAYPFYPWLHKIAINTALNHQNKISRRKESHPLYEDVESRQGGSNRSDPLAEIIQDELENAVNKAIARLPIDQRTVFILKSSDGLSYQEISQQLGISVGTVMSRLSRARAKLRILLKPYITSQDIGV